MAIEYNEKIKERYIPISYDEILSGTLVYFQTKEPKKYQELAKQIHQSYYCNYYATLKNLKSLYRCFNPDRETLTNQSLSSETYQSREPDL